MEPTATAAPTSPMTTWPGAFGAFKPSRKIVMLNLAPLLLFFVISLLINFFAPNNIAGELVSFAVSCVLSVAIISILFEAQKGVKLSVSESINRAFSLLALKYAALTICMVVIIIGSALLLIIPALFVIPRIVLAPYVLVDTNGGVFDSIKKSWELTKGHAGKSWGIIGVSVLFAILCLVLIGLYLLLMYTAVFMLFYMYTQAMHGTPSVAPEAPAPPEVTAPPASV